MSAVKFQCPPYKLYEPDYHPQKPIIVGVDDRLESPETVTLRYEEAARAASGGDPAGDSPPRLLEMAAYGKAPLPSMPGYDTSRYQDNAYEQYPAQSFNQQSVDKFAQLNQQSFAANNAVAQYMPPSVSVLSCQPTSGNAGTKVYLKISSAYDLFPISSPMPYVNLVFGSEKCAVQDVARGAQEGQGYFYSCTVEVPQLLVTGCTGSSVPLALLIEGAAGEEISRTSAGSFQYVEGSADDITRTAKIPKHDTAPPGSHADQASPATKHEEPPISSEPTTNTYEYPSQPGQYNQPYQGNNDMLTAYRTTSFTEPGYHRRPGPVWNGFGGPLPSTGRSPALDHTLTGRSSLTPLPMPSSASSGTPQLVRTSIAQNAGGYASGYFPSKASLKLNGKLDSMTENWTQEEWSERRRLVVFRKSQSGSTLHASFRPVSPSERPQGSTCISCIWWAEKGECFVTSVDTIYLLEQLVAAPNKFTVEEKNRIRRNLEGYHPKTVSKAKAESEDFFKLIMGFPHPKPRNIEKDVKVFPWKVLESALKKIIGKYCASPSSLLSHGNSMPPQAQHPPSAGGYAPLPTPPAVQTLNSQHADPHGPYAVHTGHADNVPSPRSLPGPHGAWAPYTTASSYSTAVRPSSPNARYSSPQQPSLRLATAPLPAVTSYDTRTVTTAGFGNSGLHTPVSHHPSTATPPRWEPTAANYPESYPSMSGHHNTGGQPVYSTSGYADGAPRA